MLRIVTNNTSGTAYHSPFSGPMGPTRQVRMNVTALTSAEVTAEGYLKPGVPIYKAVGADATLITAAAQPVSGVTFELQKIAATNSAADLTAAGTAQIVMSTSGNVVRQQIEDMLGRVLNANELAGFDLAGSSVRLIRP